MMLQLRLKGRIAREGVPAYLVVTLREIWDKAMARSLYLMS